MVYFVYLRVRKNLLTLVNVTFYYSYFKEAMSFCIFILIWPTYIFFCYYIIDWFKTIENFYHHLILPTVMFKKRTFYVFFKVLVNKSSFQNLCFIVNSILTCYIVIVNPVQCQIHEVCCRTVFFYESEDIRYFMRRASSSHPYIKLAYLCFSHNFRVFRQ